MIIAKTIAVAVMGIFAGYQAVVMFRAMRSKHDDCKLPRLPKHR